MSDIIESPSIVTKTTSFTISGTKIIVSDLGGKWREEININHISYVRCDSESTTHRTIGGVLGVFGMLILALSYQRIFIYVKDVLTWTSVILLLMGIVLFLYKTSKSIMTITLTGVDKSLKYQLEDVSNKKIQEFISKVLPVFEAS